MPGITTLRTGKVLVLNVEPEMAQILKVNLAHANIEFTSAESGAEALRKIAAEKPDIVLLDYDLADVDCTEVCRQLKASPFTSHVPIVVISARPRRKIQFDGVEDFYIPKPFNPREVTVLVQKHLKKKGRTENIHPFTGLPNQIQVSREISELINQKVIFAVIYISINDLRTFNNVYGYNQGDAAIRLLANNISEAVGLLGNEDDLVGHIVGDKFLIVSTPSKANMLCRKIRADFNKGIKALIATEVGQKDRNVRANLSPIGKKGPNIGLRATVVTNQKRAFNHYLEVREAINERMNYLRRLPGDIFLSDVPAGDVESLPARVRHGLASPFRDDVQAIRGILARLALLIDELTTPLNKVSEVLDSMEAGLAGNTILKLGDGFRVIKENLDRIVSTVEELNRLASDEEYKDIVSFEEIDVGDVLDWLIGYVREPAKERNIKIDIENPRNIGAVTVDKEHLTQGLLCLLRSGIQFGPPGSRLRILVSEIDDNFIGVRINNPAHYVSQRMLDRFLLGQTEGLRYQALGSELYTASRLLQEINVRFKVASERNKGITHTLIIPKRWPSWMQDVSALQLAAEICRKEARAEVQNISGMLLSLTGAAPDKIHDSLEKISSRVQELGVLCNRSLFLIDNLNRRFEAQQDHLLKWEIEQMATAEAIVHVSREIARSLELSQIFEIGSAKRVAKYALAIAKELELPEGEYQALRHAALLKDLGLVLSIDDMVKRKLVPTHEHAMSVKGCFELVWKALADVPYLSSALVSVRYRYEKYDGTAKHYGAGGTDIPLGARILAVADAFESMTASSSLEEKCSPRQAVAMISDGSGQRFDPGVVDAFMSAWKKKELHPVLNES